MIDIRTVVISYALSDAICAIVIMLLWLDHRKRFVGIGFWLAGFVSQFVGVLFIGLRGILPDFMSIVVGNTLIIVGILIFYMGLERFVDKRTSQVHNYILLAAFTIVHTYFTFVHPNLLARNINISLGTFLLCFQSAWLMLGRVDVRMRHITRIVGVVGVGYCLTTIARIIADLTVNPGNDFLRSGMLDSLLILLYQMLFVVLTFSLFLMVNRRLLTDLERDIVERQYAEEALRESEDRYRTIIEKAMVGIVLRQGDRMILANRAFCDMLGYSEEELLNATPEEFLALIHPDDRQMIYQRHLDRVAGKEVPSRYQYRYSHKTGKVVWVDVVANNVPYGGHEAQLGMYLDITNHKQAEESLRLSEEKFYKAFHSSPDAILISRLEDGQLIDVNEGFCRITGYSREEALSDSAINLGIWFNLQDRKRLIAALQEHQHVHDQVYEFNIKSGGTIVGLYSGEIIYLGGEAHILSVVRDISEQKRAEKITKLRIELWECAATHSVEELMQVALDEIGALTDSPIGFYHFVEEDQKSLSLQVWSTRTLAEFCRAEGKGLHYSIDEAGVWVDAFRQRKPVIHNDYAALPHRKGLPEGHAEIVRQLVVPVLRDGRVVSILGVGNKLSEYDENDAELISYIADIVWTIVERKRAEEQIRQLNARLEHLAMTDELTGIFNRRLFFSRGAEEVNRFLRYQAPLSLLILDVDGFKKINDTYGHMTGDQVLKDFVSTLQRNIRRTDILARLGGEEFGIILQNTKKENASIVAEKLCMAVEKRSCVISDGRTVNVTVSIGLAVASEEMQTFEALLKDADAALYKAKEHGRNRVFMHGG